MQHKPTLLITAPLFTAHDTGPGHPECPARWLSIYRALKDLPLKLLPPRRALDAEILLCHTQEYLELVKMEVQYCLEMGVLNGTSTLSTGDVQICQNSWMVANRAIGAVLAAADAIFSESGSNAFCLVRPPGHHACSNQGMGFCLFNNVAIGARYVQRKYNLNRVLIVDWDVHHGNGTQEIFYSDPSVFYFSTHQSPLYPGTGGKNETGLGPGAGTTLNCPVPADSHAREQILSAFRDQLVPAMSVFRPECIFISAGFDAHKGDPLGGLNLEDRDYSELTQIVKGLADQYSNGKIISVLEGGYHLEAIASAARAHVIEMTK